MSQETHLRNTTNVLLTVLGREAEVLVQTKANVVTIQAVGRLLQVQQVLLKRRSDRRLTRSRQTREPDRSALLLQEVATLLVRDSAGVESDVRRHGGRSWMTNWGATSVLLLLLDARAQVIDRLVRLHLGRTLAQGGLCSIQERLPDGRFELGVRQLAVLLERRRVGLHFVELCKC